MPDVPATIQHDQTGLFDWALNAAGHGSTPPGGTFLRSLAEAALHADPANWPYLFPAIAAMRIKYPDYDRPAQEGT